MGSKKKHRSIRKFKADRIPKELFDNLITAAQSASTSHNIQAYHLLEISPGEVRSKIAELAGPQKWVESAPHFFLLCLDLRKLDLVAKLKNRSLKINLELALASIIDTALFAQNLMLAAESNDLGGVFIGGIRNNLAKVIQITSLPRLVLPLFGLCLGYPDHDPDPKPRLDKDCMYSLDAYPDDELVCSQLKSYDQAMEQYYSNRNFGKKMANWSDQIANYVSEFRREDLIEVFQSQGISLT